jgi:NADH-quinone oxidoreductase subunit L
LLATGAAWAGIALAMAMYLFGTMSPREVHRQFPSVYRFLRNKWWFDELYEFLFVRPAHLLASVCAWVDRHWIDWLIDNLARCTAWFARLWEWATDRMIVDRLLDGIAHRTYRLGVSLRRVQTGALRQYVMFLVVGVIAIFLIISFFWTPIFAR